jgi:hypothetical protein
MGGGINSQLYLAGIIDVECYRSESASLNSDGAIFSLRGLKSRSILRVGSEDVYLPLDFFNQVVVRNFGAMRNFVLHILTSNLKLGLSDSLNILLGLTQTLEDNCDIRPNSYLN